MRRAYRLAAVVALSLCAVGTQAEPFSFAVAPDLTAVPQTYRLLQIDLANGATTTVGRIGYFDVEGLAMAPDGTLYGVSDQNKTLITIDTSFGRGTAVGSGNSNFGSEIPNTANTPLDFGLSFSCDGRLWMSSDTTGKFWEINRNTGAARLVGSMGANISGLAATGNGMYGVGVEGDRGLYKINLDTGAATRIGSAAGIAPFVDAGFDADSAGNLWAVLDYNPPPNSRPGDLGKQSDLVRIDAVTGAFTYVSKTVPEVEGLAIGRVQACNVPNGPGPVVPVVPVNAYQALGMLGLLVLGFGLLQVRRRLG